MNHMAQRQFGDSSLFQLSGLRVSRRVAADALKLNLWFKRTHFVESVFRVALWIAAVPVSDFFERGSRNL